MIKRATAFAAAMVIATAAFAAVRTLYIAELTPELAALGATTAVHDGVAITLWNDGSVLYGLAGDAE